jgi:hypothetical protein
MAKKKGLGDVIKSITDAVGIKQCEDCKERQNELNVLFPFHKPTPLNDEQKARVETEPLKVYNEAFRQDLTEDAFTGGTKLAVLRKLNKLL